MDWGTISPKMTIQVSNHVAAGVEPLTNEHGTADDGSDATAERAVQDHGQGLIDNDIGQQQRH